MKIRKVPASWLDSPRQRGGRSVGTRIASRTARFSGELDTGQLTEQEAADDQPDQDSPRRSADSGRTARPDNRSDIDRVGGRVGALMADLAGSR